MPTHFLLKEEHLKLLRRANVGWEDGEYGAPGINPKRPYGNSAVEADVCEILGWRMAGDDGGGPCWSSQQQRLAALLHRETETALQIVLLFAGVNTEPGLYRRRDEYDYRTWEKVGD